MPLLTESSYKRRPFALFHPHLETIFPSAFRHVECTAMARERLELHDGDFLDLDWLKKGNPKLVVISHGLEGSSSRPYVAGMAKFFSTGGWDVLAWNCRSCSGEMNRLPRLYHHGDTDDLATVVDHALLNVKYHSVALVGFSMGGSMSLKYLGERGVEVPPRVKGAAVFSVPCHLQDSALQLTKKSNQFYKNRFLSKLKTKMKLKAPAHPGIIDVSGIDNITGFEEFDERFTVPLHGFASRDDFFAQATSDRHYPNLCRPVLLVNALNDPLLGTKCYPFELARESDYLFLETPKTGGHVGFSVQSRAHTWAEERALEFLEGVM